MKALLLATAVACLPASITPANADIMTWLGFPDYAKRARNDAVVAYCDRMYPRPSIQEMDADSYWTAVKVRNDCFNSLMER